MRLKGRSHCLEPRQVLFAEQRAGTISAATDELTSAPFETEVRPNDPCLPGLIGIPTEFVPKHKKS